MTITLIAMLFFLAVLLGLGTVYMTYVTVKASPQYDLRRRLRTLALRPGERVPSDLKVEILREMSPVDKALYKFWLWRKLDRLIENAGLKLDVKVFVLIVLIAAVAGLAAGFALRKGVLFAIILSVVCAALPLFYLRANKNKRINRFTEEFPNALDMVSRSLKAGHSISAAIQLVGAEMPEPVAGLFKTAFEEQTLGLSMQDAFFHMMEKIKSPDLQLFVTALNIHKDVGGNLAEILERLAGTIRERLKIRRQVRVYSAQARLSGIILVLLPIAMAVFFFFASPGYIEELVHSTVGRYGIAFAAVAQIVGIMVIRKIINIRI